MTETVLYGPAGSASLGFQHMRICPAPFSETVAALRETIEAAGFRILAEVDSQAELGRNGLLISATRQILFFRPSILADMLVVDQSTLLEAPLKLVVMERPGGAVLIRWHDTAMAFARYDDIRLTILGQQLAATCTAIADTTLQLLLHSSPAGDDSAPHAPAPQRMAEAKL